jgi:hypothetical protein
MEILSRVFQFRSHASSDQSERRARIIAILLAAVASMGCALSASGRPAKEFQTARLVEAAEYIPCADACSPFESPASAFCFHVDDEFMVGEEKSVKHKARSASTDDLSGKEVSIRSSSHFIWVQSADGPSVKLKRGSLYEGFKERGCIADDAIAIAGSGRGDFQPLYLWFECIRDSDLATIGCARWYGNGDSDGKEWYCARTMDGAPVGPNFAIDPLQSLSGRFVLTSGGVLQYDNRARTNDKLDRPGEACR